MNLEINFYFLDFKNPKQFLALLVLILLSNISTSFGNPVPARTKQALNSVEKQKTLDNKDLRKELLKLNKFQDSYEETPCRGAPTSPPSTTVKDCSYQEQDNVIGKEVVDSTERDDHLKNSSTCGNLPMINLDFSNAHISLPVNITCNNCTYLHS